MPDEPAIRVLSRSKKAAARGVGGAPRGGPGEPSRPDGSLAYKQKFFHLHVPDTADESGADGMRVDRQGRLYVATRMGIQVCDQPGRVNAIIPTPNGRIANLCFGGPNFDIIYATCGDRVYRRKVKTQGVNAYQSPTKPPRPSL